MISVLKYFSSVMFWGGVVTLLIPGCREGHQEPFQITKKLSPNSYQVKEISTVSEDDALSLFRSRLETLNIILKPDFDPYTGKQTIPEKCLKQNLPKVIRKKESWGVYWLASLYSAAPTGFARCPDSVELVKTQYLMIFCEKQKKSFEFKYFYPEAEPWSQQPIAVCRTSGD